MRPPSASNFRRDRWFNVNREKKIEPQEITLGTKFSGAWVKALRY